MYLYFRLSEYVEAAFMRSPRRCSEKENTCFSPGAFFLAGGGGAVNSGVGEEDIASMTLVVTVVVAVFPWKYLRENTLDVFSSPFSTCHLVFKEI